VPPAPEDPGDLGTRNPLVGMHLVKE